MKSTSASQTRQPNRPVPRNVQWQGNVAAFQKGVTKCDGQAGTDGGETRPACNVSISEEMQEALALELGIRHLQPDTMDDIELALDCTKALASKGCDFLIGVGFQFPLGDLRQLAIA